MWFLLLSTTSLGLGCPVDLSRIPTAPPVAALQVQAPDNFVGGAYALRASLSVPGEINLVTHTAKLRHQDTTYPGGVQVCTSGVLQTVPLGVADNGVHRLVIKAYSYYRVFENGAWQLKKALVERREHLFGVYIPWSSDSTNAAGFLLEKWKAGKGGGIAGEHRLTVWGIMRTLSPGLQAALRQMKDGGFTDCNLVGLCAVVPPAQIRLLNDDAARFAGLVDVGCLKGAIVSGCQRPRDSRVSNVGSSISSGILLVEGVRHGYLLMGPGVEVEGPIQVIELPSQSINLFVESLCCRAAR